MALAALTERFILSYNDGGSVEDTTLTCGHDAARGLAGVCVCFRRSLAGYQGLGEVTQVGLSQFHGALYISFPCSL